MKKTKSALAIAAAAALALTMTACGPSGKKNCESSGTPGAVAIERASLPMPVSPVIPRPVTPVRPSIPKPSIPKPAAPKPSAPKPKPATPKSGGTAHTTTTNHAGMPWYWWIPFAGAAGSDKC